MIGWALRWAAIWCATAFLIVAARNVSWPPVFNRVEPQATLAAGADARVADNAALNTLVFPADSRGHVVLEAYVNGAPVRFLVDTGASYVTLTPADARAAGLGLRQLGFNEQVSTANGEVRIATLSLREIRLGQMAVTQVPAAVIEHLKISLLGMSFLNRLHSYEMRDGKLTITW